MLQSLSELTESYIRQYDNRPWFTHACTQLSVLHVQLRDVVSCTGTTQMETRIVNASLPGLKPSKVLKG